MIGYGRRPPNANFPGAARLAVQFVLNYEEGGENTVLHGDAAAETFLTEASRTKARTGSRNLNAESIFEYGSRVGVWRVLEAFADRKLPLTVFAVGMALERNPEVAAAFTEQGHEVASHAWRWIDYQNLDEATEREHMALAIAAIERTTGQRPVGWYTGRVSVNTRQLVVEHGGFLYDSDSYADDLPYWTRVGTADHLVVPYSLDCNDMRFSTAEGFDSADQFFVHLKNSFDALYSEGGHTPRMMSIGLHCRLVGRPGRILGLHRFLDYVQSHPAVWICRRADIARHWHEHHPAIASPESQGA
jgi:putative urate catabolism protein